MLQFGNSSQSNQGYLDGSVAVGSADQSTPLHRQPVAQQLRNCPRSQHPGQKVLLLQVEDAAPQLASAAVLHDDTARAPRPGVQVGHQAFCLPDDMLGGAVHSGNRRENTVKHQQLRLLYSLYAEITTVSCC